MDWLFLGVVTLIIFAVLIDIYLEKQGRYTLNRDTVFNSSVADQARINQASQVKEVYQCTNTSAVRATSQTETSAHEADADEILSRIFTIARPDTNNCLEVLMMLEQLSGKVKPEHLKKLKLLFNVYGSSNHLFDDGLVKVVATCCTCRAKFELLEHIFTESEFYTDVARSLDFNSSAAKTSLRVE